MNKLRISVLATAVAIAASTIVGSAAQAAPVPNYLQVATTPAPAAFTAGELLQIKPTVAFAWLRNLPMSTAGVIDTAKANEFVIIASPAPQNDGTQWWWAVRRGSGSVTGWIEEQALQPAVSAPTATATLIPGVIPQSTAVPSAAWTNGTAVTIAAGIPFVWIRTSPSSTAPVRVVAYHSAMLTIRDSNPVSDGTQLWWLVNYPLLNVYGWVEQKSLATTVVNPSPVPGATSTSPAVVPTSNIPTVAPTAAPAPAFAKWGVPGIVRVRQAVRYAWLRATPGGAVLVTLPAGSLLLLTSAPSFDGVQYWWPVQTTGNLLGWVEQNSLEIVAAFGPIATASAAPAPTLTPTLNS